MLPEISVLLLIIVAALIAGVLIGAGLKQPDVNAALSHEEAMQLMEEFANASVTYNATPIPEAESTYLVVTRDLYECLTHKEFIV